MTVTTTPQLTEVTLEIGGMTCASCAARIEKRLNRLDGVTATVNFATERAAVDYDRTRVVPDDLVAAVEAIGYGATPPAPASPGCSPPSALAPKWPALTPTPPNCHNPCAEGLESRPI